MVFDPLYYSKVPQNQREEYWNIFWDLIQEKNLVANLRKEPSFLKDPLEASSCFHKGFKFSFNLSFP